MAIFSSVKDILESGGAGGQQAKGRDELSGPHGQGHDTSPPWKNPQTNMKQVTSQLLYKDSKSDFWIFSTTSKSPDIRDSSSSCPSLCF